nr:hypothetical protein ACMD2_02060 [Ipomoea batatas]
MSVQETVEGQAFSTSAFMLSMTSKPRAELRLGKPFFSPLKPLVSSRSTEPSQPCRNPKITIKTYIIFQIASSITVFGGDRNYIYETIMKVKTNQRCSHSRVVSDGCPNAPPDYHVQTTHDKLDGAAAPSGFPRPIVKPRVPSGILGTFTIGLAGPSDWIWQLDCGDAERRPRALEVILAVVLRQDNIFIVEKGERILITHINPILVLRIRVVISRNWDLVEDAAALLPQSIELKPPITIYSLAGMPSKSPGTADVFPGFIVFPDTSRSLVTELFSSSSIACSKQQNHQYPKLETVFMMFQQIHLRSFFELRQWLFPLLQSCTEFIQSTFSLLLLSLLASILSSPSSELFLRGINSSKTGSILDLLHCTASSFRATIAATNNPNLQTP